MKLQKCSNVNVQPYVLNLLLNQTKVDFLLKKFKHKFFWIEYKFLLKVDLKRHTFVTLDPKKKLNLGTPHMDAP
jgi:hypothetical protein